jgi:4-diphosphocytidyl-2-C-methyl-D-erythritol kinase
MPESILQRAPAKLNLALSVGPPDESGMHPICSWMVTVNFCDELLLTKLLPDRFSRYAILWHRDARRRSDINWSIRKDLAVRAHLALEEHVGRTLPLQLKLEKRIPVGGGLGGGSSDAAAMLLGVNELFELGLSLEELASIGASLGSDVPFMVHRGSATVSGRGERIERHEQPPDLHAVIVLPDASCPTGTVYQRFDAMNERTELAEARVRNLIAGVRLMGDDLFNDLAIPAQAVAPALREAIELVTPIAQGRVHVTGSGSSLFVLCNDPLHAQQVAEAIESQTGLPAIAVRSFAADQAR